MPSIPVLMGFSGLVKGTRFPLTERGLRLGRDPMNEIHVDDHGVSRQHARFILHNGAAWVQDVGSRNGVFVNEMRVQTQRQLSVGDKVKIGEHVLEVLLEEVEEVPPPTGEGEPVPRKRWRLVPFVVAFILLGLVIGVIAVVGARQRKPDSTREHPEATASLLIDAAPVMDNGTQGSSSGATTGLGDLLSGDAKPKTSAERLKIPAPSAGVTGPELVERAHGFYRAGRLRDALVAYLQAKMVDANCEICDRRVERLETEIAQAIDEHFNAGLVYYNNLQYAQAVNEWETVLLLTPDQDSAVYKETSAYLEQARAKVQAQY